MKIESRRN